MSEQLNRRLAASKYPEDVHSGGHSAVWGSYYCAISHRWGYACCLLCDPDAECGRGNLAIEEDPSAAAGEATQSSNGQPQAPPPESAPALKQPAPVDGELPPISPQVTAEVDRILSVAKSKPLEVLGLAAGATGYAIRSAFRRLALLIHPDKNPGYEERCKEALVKAQEAREAAEGGPPAGAANPEAEGSSKKRRRECPGKEAAFPSAPEEASGREPDGRQFFTSAEEFVAYVLQFVLEEWKRYIKPAVADASDSAAKKATRTATAAAVAAQTGGAMGVLRSEAALKQSTQSVKSLRKLLKAQTLGPDVLQKVEQICLGLVSREYAEANQAYMNLAIGNRAWHLEVPTLMESGMTGCTGIERGRLFKQARTAQRLNAAAGQSVMDDDEVRSHIVALRRLLAVSQVIRPNSDPSKNAG